ncbi:MAG TPA: hypothetical protein VI776_00495 [Anaerolineales bacterium]|nr:hypothetical protein [Anaerolineales bacterium]
MATHSKNPKTPDHPFAHHIEEEFTRILDYYGIVWEYEPQTFPLEWDDLGNVQEAFSPDFYLPQQNLYIELTTLKPNLTTKKNRKIRRLIELHPEINIKLFKRADLRQLMIKYGLDKEAEKITGNQAQK